MNNQKLKYALLLTFIITITLIITQYYNIVFENFDNNITLHNMWSANDQTDVNIFQNLFENIDRYVDVYSVFGELQMNKKNDNLTVQFSGESYYNDPSLFDINFIPTDKIAENIIIMPYALYHILANKLNMEQLLNQRILAKQKDNFGY